MPLEHLLEADQPRTASGDVDLGDVAGHDRLRPEADPGEEHLHLLGAGVLRLVEDDEAVVERAAPHERERRHLDVAPVDEPLRAVGLEHVVQRVVERAQIRVDLGHQVAGEEAESLPGLDRRSGEDDPVDLPGLQRLHRERDRQVGLAGAGRADAEGHRVGRDRVDVAPSVRPVFGRTVRPASERSSSEVSTSEGRTSSCIMSMVRLTWTASRP